MQFVSLSRGGQNSEAKFSLKEPWRHLRYKEYIETNCTNGVRQSEQVAELWKVPQELGGFVDVKGPNAVHRKVIG
jgi:hypothetical protein